MSGTIERNGGAGSDNRGRRVAFVTFGCRLNKAEALDLEAQYAAAGWQIVTLKTEETPDVIIVRGCSVTAKVVRGKRPARFESSFRQ